MVMRFDSTDGKSNDVYILESCVDVGVRVQKWKNKRKHYGTFYERIVLRHLEYERPLE